MINNITSNISWFFRRIKRVIEYLPIIWNGYDFDYSHSIDIFHYQLTRTANFLDSDDAYNVLAKQDARRLRTILDLMKKVYDEEYRLEHFSKVEAIYGKLEWVFDNNDDNIGNNIILEFKNADTPEKREEASKLLKKLDKESEEKHQRAKELLWKLVEHNIENFWD